MLDQSFSLEYFNKIFEIENRKGNFEKAAADGGLFQSIKDPVAWQKCCPGNSSKKTPLNSSKTKI